MTDTPANDRCIVTLCDSHYFPGLESLYYSIQASCPVPLLCFDVGLTDAQKDSIAHNYPDLRVLAVPDTEEVRQVITAFQEMEPVGKPGKRVWPLWLCPFLIAACPFRRVIWMDCDLVILRHLDRLFDLLEQGPVFTPENLAPERTPNKPALYDLLPIERAFNPESPCINAGVSGWDTERDRPVLAAYRYPILRACHDLAVRDAIAWHDQGALIWAIQKTGMEPRVLDTLAFNMCVKHTGLLNTPLSWRPDIAVELAERVPDACVVHWNGHRVPWILT